MIGALRQPASLEDGDTLAPRVQPGYAFSIVCDLGFAVGLTTHVTKRMGSFVWIAEPIFDAEPTKANVAAINAWRWPIWLPLGSMAYRKLVIPLGLVPIPAELRSYPVMRGKLGHTWKRVAIAEDGTTQPLPGDADPTLPIHRIVNDVRLKEMLVTRWRPADHW
jgi:hypothetical protein